MTIKTEGRHPGEFILSEAAGNRSRGVVTIPAGTGVVPAGTVLGSITAAPTDFVPSPNAEEVGIEGAEVAKCICIYGADATDVDVKVAVMARDMEANGSCLEFEATVDDDAKKTAKALQLEALGIIVR